MAYISDGDWNRYNEIINNFINEDAGKQLITWRRYAGNLASFGEDAGLSYVEDTLEVLAGYNNFIALKSNGWTYALQLNLIGGKLIPYATYGNDTLRLTGIVFNQSTQTRDMHINGTINVFGAVIIGHGLPKLFTV